MADLSTPEGKLVEWLRLPKQPSHCGNFVEVHAGLLTEAADALSRIAAERDEARLQEVGAKSLVRSFTERASAAERERDELKAEVERLREALSGMVQRFELYAGPDDIHAGHHDLALLKTARAALRTFEGSP